MYDLIKKILFKIDPERTHHLTLQMLQSVYALGIGKYFFTKTPSQPKAVMGLNFPNPVGLSAGFDRNADHIDALALLGFGFIEVGTITPRPQNGNPKPRIFRLPKEKAIINQVGFASKGMDYAAQSLAKTAYRGVLGINIGKNSATPNERALADYLACFKKLAPFASYITINISSPNTKGLRDLQEENALHTLLQALKNEQAILAKYVPLVVKISPDLSNDAFKALANVLLKNEVDGVIATNTTLDRSSLNEPAMMELSGGLSGQPLFERSVNVLRQLKPLLGDKVAIIASGGVMDATCAEEKFRAGADLVAVYTGLVYRGPKLVREICELNPPQSCSSHPDSTASSK